MTTTRTAPAASPLTRAGGLLRPALRLDAVVTGANGAGYLLAAPLLDGPLGLSPGLLRSVGAFLLAYAAAVWLVAARRRISGAAVEAVIGANALWAAGSVVAAVVGIGSLTGLGAGWLVLQAAVVAGFAAVQLVGLRRR
ncbi:hypothetical protein SAMN05660748_4367 [Blastococcus aggregatus]|uniref:Integral membrane protein n=1 Tax=Blastococcus aggregatus TaxID=38502 RepID=A0A285VJ88_9ACTN|nr:hypothetical protein [Blastococcus aggregatus]SOC53266.1 hypothetical protein SAMN05660748_4367 [Blastococcus aggregatus]